MTDVLTAIQDKANDAFYAWERANNEQDLSDRDRMIWTAGWIQAKTKLYLCNGYWTDTKETFSGMVVSDGEWDGLEDAKDERIFFYTDGFPVLGEHQDFVITEVEELK
jgi:hypothetical protein